MTQAELGQYKEQLDAMGLSMTVQKDYPLIYFTMRLKEFGKGDIPKGEIKKFENDLGTSLCEGLESKVAELGSKERKNLKYVTQVMEADGAGVNVVLKDKYGQTLVDTTKKFSDCPNFRQIKAS